MHLKDKQIVITETNLRASVNQLPIDFGSS